MSFEEFNDTEVFDIDEGIFEEAEEVIEEGIVEETASPEEKIQEWAEEKATRAVESGREVVDWGEWLQGWKAGASDRKQLFMYYYISEYLERGLGLDREVAEKLAEGLVGLTFRRPEMASLFDPKVLQLAYRDPDVQKIYSDIHQEVRRASNYYISLTPTELGRVADLLATGKERNLPPREVAQSIASEITRLSPRSLYFNLYYIGRVTGDRYIADVARELSRMRRR